MAQNFMLGSKNYWLLAFPKALISVGVLEEVSERVRMPCLGYAKFSEIKRIWLL